MASLFTVILHRSYNNMRNSLSSAYRQTKVAEASKELASASGIQHSDSVLFIQGPVGPFFARIAEDFEERGFAVYKINLNGGDKLFYRHALAIDYTDTQENWSDFLRAYIEKHDISRIYVFGDCRFYHDEARKMAGLLSIDFYVFEEGYVRPNYITLEKDGVNGFSQLVGRPTLIGAASPNEEKAASAGRLSFLFAAVYSMMYYLAASFYSRKFPAYIHHRPLGWLQEGAIWLRSGYRKVINYRAGQKAVAEIQRNWDSQYFLCPLQVHCDKQVVVHSSFESIDEFIQKVITSFAEAAPENCALVFKHHPLDRGYTDYTQLIASITKELDLQDRVYYVHDVCLPKMLQQAKGAVMINSTVGLSSLFHNTPVKVLGDAIYDRKGLTFQGSLNDFWREPGEVDVDAVERFRSFLTRHNQINGNLYRRCSKRSASGVIWPGKLLSEHSTKGDCSSVQEGNNPLHFVPPAGANPTLPVDDTSMKKEDYPKSA